MDGPDIASRRIAPELKPPGGVQSIAFSGDGKRLATGSLSNDFAYVWDVTSGKLVSELDHSTGDVVGVALSNDASWLASYGWHSQIEENVARVWDILRKVPIGGYIQGDVRALAFSADGRLLATGGWNRSVDIWSIQEQRNVDSSETDFVRAQLASIPTDSPVQALALDPSGDFVAVASGAVVQVWDYRAQRVVASFDHGDTLMLDFVNHGAQLVTASKDTARVWNVREGKALGDKIETSAKPMVDAQEIRQRIPEICGRIGRNLTQSEWQQYLPDEPYRKTCEQWPLEPEVTPTSTP